MKKLYTSPKLFNTLAITCMVLVAWFILDCNLNYAWAGERSFIGKLFDETVRALSNAVGSLFKPHKDCPTMTQLMERYGICFSCMTMKVLLEAFMTACSRTYYITQEAGLKLLTIGSALWIAFTIIKHVSSLTNPEAPSMINEFAKFAFKVIVAYAFITAGISALVGLVINPILATGADFANVFLSVGLPSPTDVEATYKYAGPSDIISADVLNKILTFTENVGRRVAINMVIGNGLICFSIKAGLSLFGLIIPDIWLWLCGVVIWFVGLMLAMFVSYYLLDIAFKIGFAIMALPIVIGLWPFKVTAGKVNVVFSIILKAAATYAFLALIVTFAMVMIDQALGGVDLLFEAFENDNVGYVENKFSITEAPFLIFCVCFFYAVKLIGTNQTYANKFFPDKVFGNSAPLHEMGAKIASHIKKAAMAPVKLAGDIATHQTGRAAGGLVKGAMNIVKGKGFTGGQNAVGNTARAAGKGTQAAGSAVKGAGQAASAAGKGVDAAGKGMQAAGAGMKAAGTAMQAIPVVGNIAGAVVGAAGTAMSATGKVVSATGKTITAAGKTAQAAGNATKAAGKNIEKAGQHVNDMASKGGKTSKEDKELEEKKKKEGEE